MSGQNLLHTRPEGMEVAILRQPALRKDAHHFTRGECPHRVDEGLFLEAMPEIASGIQAPERR